MKKNKISKNWINKQRRDIFVRKSKVEGYRSRAVYKLIEIEEKKIKVTYDDFLKGKTNNIFENIVMKRYPTVARAKNWLSQFGKVKMSGTGGTIFASFNDFESAEKVFKLMPKSFDGTIVKGVE